MKTTQQNRGLIKIVLMVVLALVILGLFGINLRKSVDNTPIIKDNLEYGFELVKNGTIKIYSFVKKILSSEGNKIDSKSQN
jgi:hypothetical protein